MKSKASKSFIPMAFSDRIVLVKFVRWISGTAVGSISSRYALSVYSLAMEWRQEIKRTEIRNQTKQNTLSEQAL